MSEQKLYGARLVVWLLCRLACWFVGHRWYITRHCPIRAAILMHLHTMAGVDADCARCGAQWRDAKCGGAFPPVVVDPPRHYLTNEPRACR